MSSYETLVAAEQKKVESWKLLQGNPLSVKEFSVAMNFPIHRAQHYIDSLFAEGHLISEKGKCPISNRTVNRYSANPKNRYVAKDLETHRKNHELNSASPYRAPEFVVPKEAKPYLRVIKGRLDRPMERSPGDRKTKVDPWSGYSSFANFGMI